MESPMPLSEAVVVYHNPRCSTSRAVLEMIRGSGLAPEVVEYLKVGWTQPQLEALLAQMGAAPGAILRRTEPLAQELGLATASDDTILTAMLDHPVLVERPIVVTSRGAVVCRPVDRLWEVLDPA
jgi:arsenate reductase